jgi:hypothetical protein
MQQFREAKHSCGLSKPPSFVAPVFLFFPLYCRRVRVLHLEPIGRAARTVRQGDASDNASKAQLAGVAKHYLAVTFHVLVKPDARPSLCQDHFESSLAALKRITPQIIAVQLDQVEGVEEKA